MIDFVQGYFMDNSSLNFDNGFGQHVHSLVNNTNMQNEFTERYNLLNSDISNNSRVIATSDFQPTYSDCAPSYCFINSIPIQNLRNEDGLSFSQDLRSADAYCETICLDSSMRSPLIQDENGSRQIPSTEINTAANNYGATFYDHTNDNDISLRPSVLIADPSIKERNQVGRRYNTLNNREKAFLRACIDNALNYAYIDRHSAAYLSRLRDMIFDALYTETINTNKYNDREQEYIEDTRLKNKNQEEPIKYQKPDQIYNFINNYLNKHKNSHYDFCYNKQLLHFIQRFLPNIL